MARILVPTALRQFTAQREAIESAAATVGEALRQLAEQYPQLRKNLFTDAGKLRTFVNVYVNDEDIRYLQKDATQLGAGDTVSIVPSIAGGAPGVAEETAAGSLSREELARYSRHLILPEVGLDGQQRLKAARVLLVGAGGLGAPVALYLAAAGVGNIGVVDFDVVDVSNLQRQVIYQTADIGVRKLDAAAEHMTALNPHLSVEKFGEALSSENALAIISRFDLVIDGTDNFPTRYLVNDACVLSGKPNVYGSIFRFEGQATVFALEDGPCYRCLYPEPPPPGLVPSCAEGGVLGILPGLIGVIQATEAVKIILGKGESLKGRLLLYDALNMRFRELKLRRDPDCLVCGDRRSIHSLIDYQAFCNAGRGNAAASVASISAAEVKAKLDRHEPFSLIDVREPYEYQIASIPGAQLIPVGELPQQLDRLDRDGEVVVHCKSGGRSRKAYELLKQHKFSNVRDMTGGILAWSEQVDPTVPKY